MSASREQLILKKAVMGAVAVELCDEMQECSDKWKKIYGTGSSSVECSGVEWSS